MKYLGIDFGTKNVGLAISNAEGTIAFPRETVANDERLIPGLRRWVEDEGVDVVVVGDTRAASGEKNSASDKADAFIEALKAQLDIPVERGFEAWSSLEASRFAPKGRAHDDSAAAAIILQRFLDMHGAK
jgi:putative Holliday junction resolvase